MKGHQKQGDWSILKDNVNHSCFLWIIREIIYFSLTENTTAVSFLF